MEGKNNGWSAGKNTKIARAIKEAQNSPKIMAEIRKFVKITTGAYNLKNYRLE